MAQEMHLLPEMASTFANFFELDLLEIEIADRTRRRDKKPSVFAKRDGAIPLLKRQIDGSHHLPAIALHPCATLRQESAIDINRFVFQLCHQRDLLQCKLGACVLLGQ
jgi:hypothetical protein